MSWVASRLNALCSWGVDRAFWGGFGIPLWVLERFQLTIVVCGGV